MYMPVKASKVIHEVTWNQYSPRTDTAFRGATIARGAKA